MHLLSLYEVSTGTVLAQRTVATKENEISVAPELVRPELIKGRIYSADAMHTQKKWCRQVIRDEGDYVLIAKNNQPTLHEDIALYLDDPQADRTGWQTASTSNKGHGRLEKRTLVATTDLNDFLARDWAEVARSFVWSVPSSRKACGPPRSFMASPVSRPSRPCPATARTHQRSLGH